MEVKVVTAVRNRIRRAVGYYLLSRLRELFISEDSELKRYLSQYHFNPTIVSHPRILFEYSDESHVCRKVFHLERKIRILRGILESTTLTCSQSENLLSRLGISKFYWNSSLACLDDESGDYQPYPNCEDGFHDKKVAVYTVITGDYDNIHAPLYRDSFVDYFLFTNNRKIKSSIWKVIYIEENLDNILLSRKVKIFPHLYLDDQYETSIYVDASFIIMGPIRELTFFLNDQISLVLTKHNKRNSVYEEILELETNSRYSTEEKESMRNQYAEYVECGFSDNLGLTENGILVRRHKDKDLQSLMNDWWMEIQRPVVRDQLSLMPVIYCNHFTQYKVLNANISQNQYALLVGHNT